MSFRDRLKRFRVEVKQSLQSLGSSSTTTPAIPLPYAPTTSQTDSRFTWKSLSRFQCILSTGPGALGPLKLVVDELVGLVVTYEDCMKARQDYAALKSQLEQLFNVLSGYFSSDTPPAMTESMNNLCITIEGELDYMSSKEGRGKGRRYLEASQDLEDIMRCYRRIYDHLERLKFNADLSTWRIVDELASEARLKSLAPSNAARYNSAESLQVGRRECTPETRKQVLDRLSHWRHDSSQENMYWLSGMAGTGKTTIASSLCAMLEKSHELGASFFCTRLLPECRNVNLILPTIAYQLASFSRPFYHALSRALQQDRDLHTKVLHSQFNGLIIGPLSKVSHALPANLVVVVDALDECEDSQGVGMLLEILAQSASTLPIKIFVSSRSEPQIRHKIGHTKSQLIFHELEDSIVQEDIKLYLRTELSHLHAFISDADLATLVERAGVLFIYAATVVQYLKATASPALRQRRIQSVLRMDSSGYTNTTHAVDALYGTVLASAFDDPDIQDIEKETMRLVLHTVVCAQEPLTIGALAGLLGLEDESWVQAALEPLWSVLRISGSDDVVTTLHASFPDYMLDPTRFKNHGCQAEQQHGRLAELCFERIRNNKSQFNVCKLESSFILDKQVPDLEKRVKREIPKDLFYACRYWATHLEAGGWSVKRLEQLHQLIAQRLLLWMEVLNLEKKMAVGPMMLAKAQAWCQQENVSEDIQSLVHDAWSFATTFTTGSVCQSTPHLYVSMLASWPSSGPIANHYMPRANGLSRIQGTGMSRRQLALLSAFNAGSSVNSVALSPDGMCIASGSDDTTIRIWDTTSGNQMMGPLIGHTEPVKSVAFSFDSTRIVSGSADSTLRIWDATTGKLAAEPIYGHQGSVETVAFLPNNMCIVSGSEDGTIRLWDTTTGKQVIEPIEGHTACVKAVACSPNGAYIASGSYDYSVRVWGTTAGASVMDPLRGHTGWVLSVAFSHDGLRIVSGAFDMTVRVWDATDGTSLLGPICGHTWVVRSVAFFPDGTRIASCSEDQTIRVWDAINGEPVMGPLKGHGSSVYSVACLPDSTRLVSCSYDNTIRVWDTANQKLEVDPLDGHTISVNSVAFSPDGTRIASGSCDNTIRVWDALSGESMMDSLKGHSSWVTSVAFSPNGARIASGSHDYNICIWDTANGELIMNPLHGHYGYVLSVVFSPDGTRIVSGSSDQSIRVWDATSGQPVMGPITGHTDSVKSVAVSPDCMRIVSGSEDRTIRLWDATSGVQAMDPIHGHISSVNSVAFSPDGAYIVSGSSDNTIRVWVTTTGALKMEPLEGHTGPVLSVAFSPNGLQIVSGSEDKTVRIWDSVSGKQMIGPLEGSASWILSVSFSPDGTRVVSGSDDNILRVWDIRSRLSETDPSSMSAPTDHLSWRLDEQGWVLDSQGRHLLWLPGDLRYRLLRPEILCIMYTEGSVSLDFEGANIGEAWVESYAPA